MWQDHCQYFEQSKNSPDFQQLDEIGQVQHLNYAISQLSRCYLRS